MTPINAPGGGYRLGGYREVPLPLELRRLAEVGWLYSRIPASGPRHRVIPETGVSLCFLAWRGSEGRVEDGGLVLMGPIDSFRFFEPEAGLCLAGVRLKAEWCRDLLGADPGEHRDGLDDLPRASERRLPGLRDRLARTRTSAEALCLLAEGAARLAGACSPGRSTHLAHEALERVRDRPWTGQDAAALAGLVAVSERHLRRVIGETTGRGPKRFQRIRRLQHAVSMAEAVPSPPWARLALRAGYCDQAHMIREFRELTGATPEDLRRERRAEMSVPSNTRPG